MINQEVTILGAGPGGAAAALQLNKMKISCLLIDKAKFPRDKTCGDAISGKAVVILNRIDPNILLNLNKEKFNKNIWGLRIFAPNSKMVDIPFTLDYNPINDPVPGYVVARNDFDNHLIEEVRNAPHVELMEETDIEHIEKVRDGFLLRSKDGVIEIKTKMLLVANGAHSKFSREYAGITKEPKHYAGAVRAYYENVTGFQEDGMIELHFLKEYIPGYFWIFPMSNNRANVGLGLRSDHVSSRKMNLNKSLKDIIENYPDIKDRFKDAKLVSKIKGHPLPLGSKIYPISGDHFMLIGDAAHLIDPITGEGVGNAIFSGWIAAEQIEECIKQNDFSSSFLKSYDKRIRRVMGPELKLSYQMQRMLTYPWLINFFANQLHKNPGIKKILIGMYLDLELRKKIINPLFWLKVILKKQ
jgi:geranylgeranyl reductase family protein